MMRARAGLAIAGLAAGLARLAFGQGAAAAPGPDAVPKVADAANWPECDEYISQAHCRVTVNLSGKREPAQNKHAVLMPHAHWDVHVKPYERTKPDRKIIPVGTSAVIFLDQGSPFLKCAVAAVPAAPARDLSANVGSLLTATAGIGSVPANVKELLQPPTQTVMPDAAGGEEADQAVRNQLDDLRALEAEIRALARVVADPYAEFRAAMDKDWIYTFASEDDASKAIDDLKREAEKALAIAPPDFAVQRREALGLKARLDAFAATAPQGLRARVAHDQVILDGLLANIESPKETMAELASKRKTIRAVYDFLFALEKRDPAHPDQKPVFTQAVLPMVYFAGKTVTETITCKDASSKDPAFDNIIFIAYYEALPHFEISTGAIASLLGGRQVAELSAPYTLTQQAMCAAPPSSGTGTAPVCGPGTELGYSTRSHYQFMPGVFAEWRAKNFRRPGSENGSPYHPLGYLWSIGLAGGVAINPNNGGPDAEFFAGVSLGMQRFAVMIGAHAGRYQEFGGGYFAGEIFPVGVTVTPPTAYNWAWHPAFAIAYRVPIR
jgi:hypothetical protein